MWEPIDRQHKILNDTLPKVLNPVHVAQYRMLCKYLK